MTVVVDAIGVTRGSATGIPTAEPPAPRFPEIGVISFAPHAWGTAWTSRHHVSRSLARSFRVIWMTPTPEWRVARPWRRPPTHLLGPEPPIPGFSVDHPRWHEVACYRPASLGRFLARRRLKRVTRELRQQGCRQIVAYLWRAGYLETSRLLPFDLTIIHQDDEHNFAEVLQPIQPAEARALKAADLVFLSSPRLELRKAHLNFQTYLFPNGVELSWYRDRAPIPQDLTAIPGPRLGYTGFLRKILDWELLYAVARRRPDWQIVLVGGKALNELPPVVSELERLPNIHFLGYRSSREMVAYQQHFDVGLLPYAMTAYTDCIYPVKLHEYLAAGLPTVGTPIRSLQDFPSAVELASSAEDWEAAIERQLSPEARHPDRIAARWRTAAEYDWSDVADAAANAMVTRLRSRQPADPGSPVVS